MPQYVSLEQSGFYKPFEMLNETINRVKDRRQRRSEFDREQAQRTRALDMQAAQDLLSPTGLWSGNFVIRRRVPLRHAV